MKKKSERKETFAGIIQDFTYHFDLRPVFDDFLTMMLATLCMDPATGKSYDEELYMAAIAPYAKHDLRHRFPKMYAALIIEMEERAGSSEGNDVLGEFFERELSKGRMGQFFTPWPVCELMARINHWDEADAKRRLRVLDPCCGSGRMLVAGSRVIGPFHDYYGIDVDHTCTKMAAVNLFLNGVFHGEVMCANALSPDDFRVSYRLSMLPFGVFRISDKEKSPLWHLHRNSFLRQEPVVPQKEPGTLGSQLSFF